MSVVKQTTKTYSCEKNRRIAEKGKATRQRRKHMIPKTYHLKIAKSSNTTRVKKLRNDFYATKWIYNDIIAFLETHDLDEYDDKKKTVNVRLGKNSDEYETRDITHVSSRIKQSLVARTKTNLKSLSTRKKNGGRTGKLDFIKETPSIPLSQHGIDFKIDTINRRIFIAKVGWFRVHGMKQISQDAEIANATVNETQHGYIVNLTVYEIPTNETPSYKENSIVGLDYGIATSIATSAGDKYVAGIDIPGRLRGYQRKLSRQEKGSRNYTKTVNAIRRLYEDLDFQKDDLANKFVSDLLGRFEFVVMQDENLSGWKKLFGSRMQTGILGRVKKKLMLHPRVIVLKRSVATTQFCPKCNQYTKCKLGKKMYSCQYCDYVHEDRDIHAATNMVLLAMMEENINWDVTDEVTYRRLRDAVVRKTRLWSGVPLLENVFLNENVGKQEHHEEARNSTLLGGDSFTQEAPISTRALASVGGE